MNHFFDVIIIGAGAGGMSAALWCRDLNLDALMLEQGAEIGGQLLRVYNPIENYLGARAANGRALRDTFAEQIEAAKIAPRTSAEIVRVDLQLKRIRLQNGEEFAARSLILATGVRRRRLNVAGEREFTGRGILESGKRDRQKFAGKNVCVIGGGDAALENALILAEVCKRIMLIHRGATFRARREFIEQVNTHPRIGILFNAQLQRIIGTNKVEAIEIQNARGETERIEVEGVLIRIGVEPNTEIFHGQLETDAGGYIIVTNEQETSVENVFAVGDVSNPRAPTVSGAVGAGATAAKVIRSRLMS